MSFSEKVFTTLLYILYIPFFRILLPFFIKKSSTALGDNLKGFFTPSFKILEFLIKFILPLGVIVLIYNLWSD